MILPINLIERLKGFDLDCYDDKSLENLCQNIIDTFLDETKSVECDANDLVSTMGSIIIKSASTNIEPEALKEALIGQNGEENRACLALLKAYSSHFKQLKEGPLKTVGWKYPQLVDIDFKLSGIMESDTEIGIKEPLAELTFTSLASNETKTEDFSFVCTKQQLQDIQWKVREAHALLKKMALQ